MNIKKNHSKKIIWIIIALFVATVGAIALLLSQKQNENRTIDSPTSKDSRDAGQQNDQTSPTPDQTDNNTTQPQGTGSQNQKDNNSYVDVPISTPPNVNDPYPIENEHYKISRATSTKYHITLYPIANNPNQSDYQAQLKAYKGEALSYLKKRYGNIDKFVIEWTPRDAKDA